MIENKKKILFICHRIPFPPNKGDKIRTYNEVKYFSKTYNIDIISFADDPKDLKYTSDLKAYCRHIYIYPLAPLFGKLKGLLKLILGGSISEGYFYDKKACKKVSDLLKQKDYHTIFCFSSPMAEYVFKNLSDIEQKTTRPKLIMDFCDVDSDKWKQYSEKSTFPMNFVYQKESERLLKYEKKINKIFDASIFVSDNEAKLFKQLVPKAENVISISNGVDFNYFSHSPEINTKQESSSIIMFAGAMDYYANIEGVTWFCKKIFPKIRAMLPATRFLIVGSNPTPAVKELAHIKNVEVTGFVEDIRPYYKKAAVCAIPLRIARGVQNKVLEAMAMGKPVVSTSVALDGIQAENGKHIIKTDDPEKFAQAIINLMDDPSLSITYGKAARKFVEKKFSWDSCLKKLDTIIEA